MTAFYNEKEPYAALWLRNLIAADLIAPGVVDERDIRDIKPADLAGFTQCHFFAGIGGWPLALRMAGWPDDRECFSGSCPCQPFSLAGRGEGFGDDRHLWPVWFNLIRERRPSVVFGEQVQAAIGHGWLDLVCDDMENENYAVGAIGAPACSVSAPHIRQRLWFVADADGNRCDQERRSLAAARIDGAFGDSVSGGLADAMQPGWPERRPVAGNGSITGSGGAGELGDATSDEQWQSRLTGSSFGQQESARRSGLSGTLGDAVGTRLEVGRCEPGHDGAERTTAERTGRQSFWADAEWIECLDGKARPTQPGIHPLAHGISGRVGALKAYGNAIVPALAAEFIKAYIEAKETIHG